MWSTQFEKIHEKKGTEEFQNGLQMKSIEKCESIEEESKSSSQQRQGEDENVKDEASKERENSAKSSSANLMETFVMVDHKDAKDEVDSSIGSYLPQFYIDFSFKFLFIFVLIDFRFISTLFLFSQIQFGNGN